MYKISVPDRNVEPLEASIQHDYYKDVAIRLEPELKDGALALAELSYHTW